MKKKKRYNRINKSVRSKNTEIKCMFVARLNIYFKKNYRFGEAIMYGIDQFTLKKSDGIN